MSKKDLVQIIRDNPGAVAIVDNDCWTLYSRDPYDVPDYVDEDAWRENITLADDRDVVSMGSGYGSGSCYGGDLLQACAVIAGIKVESV